MLLNNLQYTMASNHGNVAHLLPQTYKRMVSAWLEEDCTSFDYGGFVVGDSAAEAKLLGKSPGIIAGVSFFDEVFRQLDCTYDFSIVNALIFCPVVPTGLYRHLG